MKLSILLTSLLLSTLTLQGCASETEETSESNLSADSETSMLPGQANARVFITFDGFERDEMRALASTLMEAGWPVIDAHRGGERVSALRAGIRELHYFNAVDASLAKALAATMKSAGKPVTIKFRTDLDPNVGNGVPRVGQLELYLNK